MMATPGLLIKQPWSLQIDEVAQLGIPQMTTTERDNLTPVVNGMIIYNTTLSKFQMRVSNGWASVGVTPVLATVSDTNIAFDTAEDVLVSTSLTTTGGNVLCVGKCFILAGTGRYQLRLYRDTTMIDFSLIDFNYAGAGGTMICAVLDPPAAGTYTYELRAVVETGTTATAYQIKLNVLELQ